MNGDRISFSWLLEFPKTSAFYGLHYNYEDPFLANRELYFSKHLFYLGEL